MWPLNRILEAAKMRREAVWALSEQNERWGGSNKISRVMRALGPGTRRRAAARAFRAAQLLSLKNQIRLDSDFHSSLLQRPGGSVCRMLYIALESAQSSFIFRAYRFAQVCAYQGVQT